MSEVEQVVDKLLEQSFDQMDFGKPKRDWETRLDQLHAPPEYDRRGSWLRKKTLEQHGLDHGHLFHFVIPATQYMPIMEVFVAFDTLSLDVIWTEGEDVAWSKFDYGKFQDEFPVEYERGDLKELATLAVEEQDLWDTLDGDADELLSEPLEFVPFTRTLIEI